MADYRKLWIKHLVLLYLDETDGTLFDHMCLRHGNVVGKMLTDYLENTIVEPRDFDRRLFLVYKTYYDKVVREEVLVAEQGKFVFIYNFLQYTLNNLIQGKYKIPCI